MYRPLSARTMRLVSPCSRLPGMLTPWSRLKLAALVGLLSATASPLAAQQAECSYRECALSVVPRWNGLAVVRGEQEVHLATLGFFRAGSLRGVFDADPRAAEFGRRAVRTRRLAAFLTDAGAVALAVGLVRAAGPHGADGTARGVTVAGAAAFGLSVPLQFKADGELSRAVWYFNARFARSAP